MRCERLHELLPAYIDGDLSGRLNQHVSDHLDGCESCRRELTAQQWALRALGAGRHPVSIDLWADFSRRLHAQSPPPSPLWRFLWQRGPAIATAAAAVAFVAGFATRPGPAPQSGRLDGGGVTIARAPLPSEAAGSPQRALGYGTGTGLSPRLIVRSPSQKPAVQFSLPSVASRAPSHQRQRVGTGRRSGHHFSYLATPVAHLRSGRPFAVLARMPIKPAPAPRLGGRLKHKRRESDRQSPERLAAGLPKGERAASSHSRSRPQSDSVRTGDPLRVAVALASIEQDTASDQMGGELLRMAREVSRVSGEAGTGEITGSAPGTATPNDNPLAARTTPAGT